MVVVGPIATRDARLRALPPYDACQVQFELLFGAIFLRGLSQVKGGGGVEDGAQAESGLGDGQSHGIPATTSASHHSDQSFGGNVEVRPYKERELEVRDLVALALPWTVRSTCLGLTGGVPGESVPVRFTLIYAFRETRWSSVWVVADAVAVATLCSRSAFRGVAMARLLNGRTRVRYVSSPWVIAPRPHLNPRRPPWIELFLVGGPTTCRDVYRLRFGARTMSVDSSGTASSQRRNDGLREGCVGHGVDPVLIRLPRARLRLHGRPSPKMILECLCDFTSDPTFLVELFVNYDCDVEVGHEAVSRVTELGSSAQRRAWRANRGESSRPPPRGATVS